MDEVSIFQEFDKLEGRLDGLVSTCQGLKAENSQLEAKVRALEEELQQKAANENRLMEERSMVRSRIDALLSRISGSFDAGQDELTD